MFRQFLPPDPCVSLLRKKADCLYKRFRFVPGIQLIPEFLQKHQHLAEQIHFTGVAADISGDLIKNFPDPAGMRQMNQSQVFREKLTGAKLTALVLCLAGCVLVFVPSMGLFFISDLLGGAKTLLLGNLIKNELMQARNWPMGATLSIAMLLFTFAFILIYKKVTGAKNLGGIR